ncbi:hypothetical protein [Pseudonocardia hydrocarbonoxydans]|uniref:Response regulatory domain-containing protein n=1 Tax=Pseudonocardia hydrocarbonoxydans TaxID=76726 RepID=A0A4Y3WL50_9PSEU|nr:hypothetical protein [Pseudonocardia hydrocarbonoxydans]GEC18629.1 hypothetical protein PHY01_09120 [Pseudonocardia hydrocarbonoxydans]
MDQQAERPCVQLVVDPRDAGAVPRDPLAAALDGAGFAVQRCSGRAAASRWLDEVGNHGPVAVLVVAGRSTRVAVGLCRELSRVAPWVVVVVMDAAGVPGRVVDTLEAGADDCVPARVHPEELVARLRAHLRRRAGSIRGGRHVAGQAS